MPTSTLLLAHTLKLTASMTFLLQTLQPMILLFSHCLKPTTHIAVDPSRWCIFGPDEDVLPEFRTADGHVSDEQDYCLFHMTVPNWVLQFISSGNFQMS